MGAVPWPSGSGDEVTCQRRACGPLSGPDAWLLSDGEGLALSWGFEPQNAGSIPDIRASIR